MVESGKGAVTRSISAAAARSAGRYRVIAPAWAAATTSPSPAPTRPSRWKTGTAMEHDPTRASCSVTA